MKLNTLLSLSLLTVAAMAVEVNAGGTENNAGQKKVMVAFKTDDVELHEMDLSHLQPGDSETIRTDSGKTIDLLRTEDDVEVYIDGKLLDAGSAAAGQHRAVRVKHEDIDIVCADDAECEEMVLLSKDELEAYGEQHDGEKVVIIRKEVITH